jgi:hypothetical protein
MKRATIILSVSVLALLAAFAVYRIYRSDRSRDRKPPAREGEIGAYEAGRKAWEESVANRKTVIEPFPPTDQMSDPDLISEGKYKGNDWNYKDTTFSDWRNVPVGTPGVKLRFLRPDETGELVPCPVDDIHDVVPFDGTGTIWSRYAEIGGTDCAAMGERGSGSYSYAAVFPLVSEGPETYSYDYWLMGATYMMTFRYRENGKWKNNHRLVKMPEDVPEGKMAVIDVDVTKEQERWWEKTVTLTVRVRKRIRSSHMALHLGLSRGMGDPDTGVKSLTVGSDGMAKTKLNGLGGDLRLATGRMPGPPAMQYPQLSYPMWYVKSVDSSEIVLPDDADIALTEENLVDFRLRIPTSKLPDGVEAIGLVAVPRGQLALWHSRIEEKNAGVLKARCVPGTYKVLAYGATSAAWGNPSALRMVREAVVGKKGKSVLGKITIKKSDAGKTLEVAPPGQ